MLAIEPLMKKVSSSRVWFYFLILVSLVSLLMMACSGGGGDSGGTTGLTYTGSSDRAAIDADNADQIAASAYSSGTRATVFAGVASLNGVNPNGQGPGRPFLFDITQVLESAAVRIDFPTTANPATAAALQSDSGSISGACGGSASYSIRGDSNTGVFSGNLSFNSFCEDGMTINGTSTFNGVLDPNTGELESFVFGFDNITGTSSTESFAMDGDIDFTVSGSSIIMTMDMLIQCNGQNTYKVEDFQMTVTQMTGTEGSGYTEIAVSGRFYDPAYGYVTLSTPSAWPFLVSWNADYPYSGELVLEGAIGVSGDPTRARLTAVSATTCQVVADTDGDGDYDYNSGHMAWTDI